MPEQVIFHTENAQQTRELGLAIAPRLSPGSVLGFEGPLGAGKTTLIQGICEGLGVTGKVASPTFVLMHVYEGKIPVYHFDLYRLEPKDLEDLGWEEVLEGRGVGLVEWIDRAPDFPFPNLRVSIRYGKTPESREFYFQEAGMPCPWLSELA